MKKDSKKNNLESIDNKIKKKEQAKKIVKEYLKPSCEEKLSQEDYPQIKIVTYIFIFASKNKMVSYLLEALVNQQVYKSLLLDPTGTKNKYALHISFYHEI